MPALGNFRRIIGSTADMSELEYISALHQTILPNLREDGTISAKDIAMYLKSRYGLVLTSAEAIDIACGLCGAKQRTTKFNQQVQTLPHSERREGDENMEKEDNEEDDDAYCFDLVHVAALLLIPEMLEYAEAYKAGNTAAGQDNIFEEVLESLIEPLDEVVEDEIRGGVPLSLELLRKILICGGDMDTTKDEDLMKQMLEDLGGEGSPFNVNTFISALTSDIAPVFASKDKAGEQTVDENDGLRTSTFFDVLGFNWEDGSAAASDKAEGLTLVKTRSFIDYAADTYNSIFYNTCVWSLFLMSMLIWGSYIQNLIRTESGSLVCNADEKHMGCKIGNSIVLWICIATFCGLFGMVFLLPTSVGNVPGRKGWLLFSLFMTALFSFLPFGFILGYREGIPHDVISTDYHAIVCPYEGEDVFLSVFPDGKSLTLDANCKSILNWCQDHLLEAHGKYLDSNPEVLTKDEFDVCEDFLKNEVTNYFYFMPGGNCTSTSDCEVGGFSGECGLEGLDEETLDLVCCTSGKTIPLTDDINGTVLTYDDGSNITVCSDQAIGATCFSNDMCNSKKCDLETTNKCVPETTETCERNCPVGTSCTYIGASVTCASGFCYEGKCALQPDVCLNDNVAPGLGGYVIDPFCRVPEVWCTINDVDLLYFGFLAINEFFPITTANLTEMDPCTGTLTVLAENGLVRFVNETEDNYKYTDDEITYNSLESLLKDNWSYFVFLSTAVMGGLAFLAQVSTVRGMFADERPRDHAVKCAAKAKVSKMIGNALSLHDDKKSDIEGMTMRNYFTRGKNFKDVGGLWWTISQIRSDSLTMCEGIHIPGRIYIGMVCQIAVLLIALIVAGRYADEWGSDFQEIRDDISKTYTDAEVKEIPDYEWINYDDAELKLTSGEETILKYIPEQWMIVVPIAISSVFAGLVAIFCILVYIPSYVNSVLKLRCGKLPSLHDPYIGILRKSGDNVGTVVGNMVFSLMGASFMSFLIVFVPVFVVCWPITRDVVTTVAAIGIGIGSTMAMKILGQSFFRAVNFRGLYRIRPASANMVNLFFECWYTGIGLLVVITRLAIFITAGALWLGRIDVDFLHPNVKVMGVNLDSIPDAFKRNMLVHEAHSHPYIDRLGGMYLRRLRHGDKFGSVSGANWRALFVIGLMPWLIKHRVTTDEVAVLMKAKGTGQGEEVEEIVVEAVEAAK